MIQNSSIQQYTNISNEFVRRQMLANYYGRVAQEVASIVSEAVVNSAEGTLKYVDIIQEGSSTIMSTGEVVNSQIISAMLNCNPNLLLEDNNGYVSADLTTLLEEYDILINGNVISLGDDGAVNVQDWFKTAGTVVNNGYPVFNISSVNDSYIDNIDQLTANFFPTVYGVWSGGQKISASDIINDLTGEAQSMQFANMAFSVATPETGISDFVSTISTNFTNLSSSAASILSRITASASNSSLYDAVGAVISEIGAQVSGVSDQGQTGNVFVLPDDALLASSNPMAVISTQSTAALIAAGAVAIGAAIASFFKPVIGLAVGALSTVITTLSNAERVDYFSFNSVVDGNGLYSLAYEYKNTSNNSANHSKWFGTVNNGEFTPRNDYFDNMTFNRTIIPTLIERFGYFISDTGTICSVIYPIDKTENSTFYHVGMVCFVRPQLNRLNSFSIITNLDGATLETTYTPDRASYFLDSDAHYAYSGGLVIEDEVINTVSPAGGLYGVIHAITPIALAQLSKPVDYSAITYDDNVKTTLTMSTTKISVDGKSTYVEHFAPQEYAQFYLNKLAWLFRDVLAFDNGETYTEDDIISLMNQFGANDEADRHVFEFIRDVESCITYMMAWHVLSQFTMADRNAAMLQDSLEYQFTASWGAVIYRPSKKLHFDYMSVKLLDLALSIVSRIVKTVVTATAIVATVAFAVSKIPYVKSKIHDAKALIFNANRTVGYFNDRSNKVAYRKAKLLVGLENVLATILGVSAFASINVDSNSIPSNAGSSVTDWDTPISLMTTDEKINLAILLIRGF